jgi:hypothetical protein
VVLAPRCLEGRATTELTKDISLDTDQMGDEAVHSHAVQVGFAGPLPRRECSNQFRQFGSGFYEAGERADLGAVLVPSRMLERLRAGEDTTREPLLKSGGQLGSIRLGCVERYLEQLISGQVHAGASSSL